MLPPRAIIFIVLNVIRFFSIVALILVFSSSIFTMVKDVEAVNSFMSGVRASGNSSASFLVNCDYIENSTVPNQPAGVFWAVLNRLFIIFQVIALMISEVGWLSAFMDRFFPVLGPSFGLGPLGIFQGLLGAAILSHHVDDLALVSAFFLFSIGCVNMLLGLIFRDSARERRSFTKWRSEKNGVLPINDQRPPFARPTTTFMASTFGSAEKAHSARSGSPSMRGYGFGRQGEKAAGLKGFLISKPLETLPRYAPKPAAAAEKRHSSGSSMYSEDSDPKSPHFKSSPQAI